MFRIDWLLFIGCSELFYVIVIKHTVISLHAFYYDLI